MTIIVKRMTLNIRCFINVYQFCSLFTVIRYIFAPEEVKDQSYAIFKQRTLEHFTTKVNVLVERYKFNSLNQLELQTSQDFIIKLRKHAMKCAFGESLEKPLRDQFVIGIWKDETRKQLLANPKLNYDIRDNKSGRPTSKF